MEMTKEQMDKLLKNPLTKKEWKQMKKDNDRANEVAGKIKGKKNYGTGNK